MLYSRTVVFKRVLEASLPCTFCMQKVSDKGDIQNVQGRGASRTRLKTTVLEVSYFKHSQALHGYYHIRPLGFSRKLPCSLITVTETDVQPLTPRRCSELRSAVFLSLTPLLLAHTDFLIKHDEKCAAHHSRLLQACFAICEDRPVSEWVRVDRMRWDRRDRKFNSTNIMYCQKSWGPDPMANHSFSLMSHSGRAVYYE